MGADAIVIEGSEAGGHIGPVSTGVLAQEILPHLTEVPVFVAGGIGRGEAMLAYLEMGASGVQLGTRFVCAHESIAHPRFKQAFIRAAARDAVASVQLDPRFPVIPVRALANSATERFVATQRRVIERCVQGELSQGQAQELVSQALAVLAARSQGMRQRQLVLRKILPGSQAPADD
jgi:enoyl-[acyl-carrier protein] reductase II